MEIKFVPVAKKHYLFLYELLKEREFWQNISHVKMPTYQEHCNFNDSKPYKADYVITTKNKPIGRIYLMGENNIGIFIKKKFRKKGYGCMVIKKFLNKFKKEKVFYANISPQNIISQVFFIKNNFKPFEFRYRFQRRERCS